MKTPVRRISGGENGGSKKFSSSTIDDSCGGESYSCGHWQKGTNKSPLVSSPLNYISRRLSTSAETSNNETILKRVIRLLSSCTSQIK